MRTILPALAALAVAACGQPESEESPAPFASATQADYAAQGMIAQSLPDIADALDANETSAEALVEAYLARIDRIDRNGPTLQSILSVNPDALAAARAADQRRASGETLGPLDGVPVVLKDNIETRDPIATTAGALALRDNVTGRDSPLAAGLRAQGAIILGKTNLSQWANFRSNNSMSGWSALGGQVRNPHMLDRNPCGSSSGSGAAVAAALAAGAVGTETNGSIICPANANGIVGFKPSVGLVSQDFIIPISTSQDTAGPMTRTVKGAAMMMNAMVTGAGDQDFVAALDGDALKGARIGVMRFAQGQNSDIIALFDAALSDMAAAGATLVEISDFQLDAEDFWGDSYDLLLFEFKDGLDAYLRGAPADIPVRSLKALIAFNAKNAASELALFDQSIFEEAVEKPSLDTDDYRMAKEAVQRAARQAGIDKLMSDHDVDVLVSPSGVIASRVDPVNGDVWPDWAGGGYLAAIAGYPHASVPMGGVRGLPLGVSFIGAKDHDSQILSFAYAYEQATQKRLEPGYLKSAEDRPEIAAAMARRDD